MSSPTDADRLVQQLNWMGEGEAFLASHLADAPLQPPSLLPGWTRAHVAAHLVSNAHGLLNLLHWARTGQVTPMYASAQERARQIEDGARLPDTQLHKLVRDSADALGAAASALPARAWAVTVRSGLGREIPASEVVWLRARETWIHAVDLATGAWFDAMPDTLVDALIADVGARLSTHPDCPPVTLAADDRVRTWSIGPPNRDPAAVRGTASDLLGWITGRAHGRPTSMTARPELPPLPAWL